eukprot:m.161376 g.161376  ORF g.161376 m.161376 type:complete len:471 (-) comp17066_c2_seq3:1013-2425(-)
MLCGSLVLQQQRQPLRCIAAAAKAKATETLFRNTARCIAAERSRATYATLANSSMFNSSIGIGRQPATTTAATSASSSAAGRVSVRRYAAHVSSSPTEEDLFSNNHTQPPSVRAFYDTSLDAAVAKAKESTLTVGDLFRFCHLRGSSKFIRGAQFLKESLTGRIAQRLHDFHQLPLIVVSNPYLKTVYCMYWSAFEQLKALPPITKEQDERMFTELMKQFMDDHRVVIDLLGKGCSECRHMIAVDKLNQFIERTVSSRIGIRLLISQQIALYNKEGQHGVFELKLSPKEVIESCASTVASECRAIYGRCPTIEFKSGHNVKFAFIRHHLEHIVTELLKNSFVSSSARYSIADTALPPVEVTICGNEEDVIIRFSDQGGGISNRIRPDIWRFVRKSPLDDFDFVEMTEDPRGLRESRRSHQAGFGFGLPMSRAYAEYFGGELTVISMHGLGCDVFLRLQCLDINQDRLVVH